VIFALISPNNDLKKKKENVCILILVAIFFKSKHIKRFFERYRTILPRFLRILRHFTKEKLLGVGLCPLHLTFHTSDVSFWQSG